MPWHTDQVGDQPDGTVAGTGPNPRHDGGGSVDATVSLALPDAVRLVSALLGELARSTPLRLLMVKGDSLAFHGLRSPRLSSDVDVLVHPDDFEALLSGLAVWGWRQRIGGSEGRAEVHHSVTLMHDSWPCDIDVHRRFPGFLAAPEKAFDALWDRRVLLRSAAKDVPATDFAGSVLVMALHALRNAAKGGANGELGHLATLAEDWDEAQRDDITDLAIATGCAHALTSVWPILGMSPDVSREDVPANELRAWRHRLESDVPGAWVWVEYIRSGSLFDSLRRLKEAIWLSEDRMRASRVIAPGRKALNRARRRRLREAVRGLVRPSRAGRSTPTRDH